MHRCEHFDDPASLPLSRVNDKRKNYLGFSIFWDIINSWLDIQTGFEKKVRQKKVLH